jgi:general secretion pathway protein D
MALNPSNDNGNGAVMLEVEGAKVGVSAVEETNSLLVRSNPAAWKSIRDVIERLDVMPLQVQIEAQIVEVQLTGDLKYGVNWFFEQAVNAPTSAGGAGLPSALGRGHLGRYRRQRDRQWRVLDLPRQERRRDHQRAGFGHRPDAAADAVRDRAQQRRGHAQRRHAHSDRIGDGQFGHRQHHFVRAGAVPRYRRDPQGASAREQGRHGVPDLVQEVSSPGALPARCNSVNALNTSPCNPPVNTRKLKTEAAVQSGDTVMLAGLISDTTARGSTGFPGLSRIPIIGGLFGTQTSRNERNEVVVLLTPSIIRNPQEARDSHRRIRRPLPRPGAAASPAAGSNRGACQPLRTCSPS